MCTRAARTAHHVTPTLALVLAGHISQRLLVLSHNMPAERHEENRPQALEGKPPSPSEDHAENKLRSNAEGSGGGGTDGGGGGGGGGGDAEMAAGGVIEVVAKVVPATIMGRRQAEIAFAACKKPHSKDNENAAVVAVVAWLKHVAVDKPGEYATLADETNNTMLVIASENGYPEVVRTLLKDEALVKFELKVRAKETRLKLKMKAGTAGGFTLARQLAKHAKEGELFSSCSTTEYEKMPAQETSPEEWEGVNGRKARCKSCYDLITLYRYIGEEIADVPTLTRVIAALHELGWRSMDDIQDHWGDVSKELRKKSKVERALVIQLSEARYNYGSWDRQFKEKGRSDTWHVKIKDKGNKAKQWGVFCKALVFALFIALFIFVPGIVLVIYYHLVHYEEQLWIECFSWLYGFALAQIVAAFLTAPRTGWGMIKESSREKDLGVTLKGSMSTQAIVSTLLFSTIIRKLQVNLSSFDLTNNVTHVIDYFDDSNAMAPDAADFAFAEYALVQWYAVYTCIR
eukprot:scaffold7206_cov57-Phaeocystis_antarctica.AAC.8